MLRATAVLSLIAVALAACALASAQTVVVTGGDYGGGALVSAPDAIVGSSGSQLGAGNALVGLRVADTGAVRINATLGTACEGTPFSATATLGSGGAFRAAGVRRRRLAGGRTLRASFEIRGTVSGAAASGTARVRNRITRGRRTTSCASPSVRWSARRPGADIGAAGADARTLLYGTTSQRLGGVKRAFVLRTPDAGVKGVVLYDVTLRCDGRASSRYFGAIDDVQVASDGSIREEAADVGETISVSADDVAGGTNNRTTNRLDGRVGALGATGNLAIASRVINIRTGRRVASCSSGAVTFGAAP